MRIGCLQFAPQVGDVNNNLNRADSLLSRADEDDLDSLDLLVLPELAFTGYNFQSLQHISQFLEHSGCGISSLWARTTALKYNCAVVVGYPEKVDVADRWPTSPEYYNSAIIVNNEGETIGNYRKHFLYMVDETWALEGKGFYDGFIPGLGQTALGICMDINPYRFEAPWDAFEFGFHVQEVRANLVIISMAWLTREHASTFSQAPLDPDMDTLIYWVQRLEPIIRDESHEEIIVVFCNRTGMEDDVVYAGTSAVIGIKDGEVSVYGVLGRGEKNILVVDTDDKPFGKLVHRPETPVKEPGTPQNPARLSQTFQLQPNLGHEAAGGRAGSTSPSSKQASLEPKQHTRKGKPPPVNVEAASKVEAWRKLNAETAAMGYLQSPEITTPTAPSPVPLSLRPDVARSQSQMSNRTGNTSAKSSGRRPREGSASQSVYSATSPDTTLSLGETLYDPLSPPESFYKGSLSVLGLPSNSKRNDDQSTVSELKNRGQPVPHSAKAVDRRTTRTHSSHALSKARSVDTLNKSNRVSARLPRLNPLQKETEKPPRSESRNKSRSQNRKESPTEHKEEASTLTSEDSDIAAFSQLLAAVAERQTGKAETDPIEKDGGRSQSRVGRPFSPKSRNASRTGFRPATAIGPFDPSLASRDTPSLDAIPIALSPGVYQKPHFSRSATPLMGSGSNKPMPIPENRSVQHSMTVGNHDRSQSRSRTEQERLHARSSSVTKQFKTATPNSVMNAASQMLARSNSYGEETALEQSPSRSDSRGRQTTERQSTPTAAPGRDTSRHERQVSRGRPGYNGATSGESLVSSITASRDVTTPKNRKESPAVRVLMAPKQREQTPLSPQSDKSDDIVAVISMVTPRRPDQGHGTPPSAPNSKELVYEIALPPGLAETLVSQPYGVSSIRTLDGTPGTITPQMFDPPTPKAMKLLPEMMTKLANELMSPAIASLTIADLEANLLKSVDAKPEVQRRRSAVW